MQIEEYNFYVKISFQSFPAPEYPDLVNDYFLVSIKSFLLIGINGN